MVASVFDELGNCLLVNFAETVILVKVLFLVLLEFKEGSGVFLLRVVNITKHVQEGCKLLLDIFKLIGSKHVSIHVGLTSSRLELVGLSSTGTHIGDLPEATRAVGSLESVHV